ALFTTTSSRPCSSTVDRTSAATAAGSVTSQPTPRQPGSSAAVAAAWSGSRSARTTRAPCPARVRAMAAPIPLAAPVTTAVRPASSWAPAPGTGVSVMAVPPFTRGAPPLGSLIIYQNYESTPDPTEETTHGRADRRGTRDRPYRPRVRGHGRETGGQGAGA